MLIKSSTLAPLLKKKLNAVYILIGTEAFLLNAAADEIKQSFQQQTQGLSTRIEINSAGDWDLLFSEANSYSLFSDDVLLDARYDKKSLDAAGKTSFQDYLTAVNARCLILLRAPHLTAKSLTALANHPQVMVVQNNPLTPQALKQWIAQQCRSRNLLIQESLIDNIFQYMQGNMLACAQLLDKLTLCTVQGDAISEALLRDHLHDQANFELYELADACLTAQSLKALRLLQYAKQTRVEPTLILWIFTQEIRLLMQIKQLTQTGLSLEAACKQLSIWPSKISNYANALPRLMLQTLHQLLQSCAVLDEAIKTGQSGLIWHCFDQLILKFCNCDSIRDQ